MATAEAIAVRGAALVPWTDPLVPAIPWRDPQTVSKEDLAGYIATLERTVELYPDAPAPWTCLGMAYAVNYDVDRSMHALETATQIAPDDFWARLKYAELQYRLRTLARAEEETLKAVDLAENAFQLAAARRQLRDIRAIHYRRVPTVAPSRWGQAVVLTAILVFAAFAVLWR